MEGSRKVVAVEKAKKAGRGSLLVAATEPRIGSWFVYFGGRVAHDNHKGHQ